MIKLIKNVSSYSDTIKGHWKGTLQYHDTGSMKFRLKGFVWKSHIKLKHWKGWKTLNKKNVMVKNMNWNMKSGGGTFIFPFWWTETPNEMWSPKYGEANKINYEYEKARM